MTLKRMNPNWIAYGGAALAIIAILLLSRSLAAAAPWLRGAIIFVVLAFTLACTIVAWRRSDEVVRDGQKTAWLFGGTVALLLAVVPYAAAPTAAIEILQRLSPAGGNPTAAFNLGIVITLGVQMVGYFVALGLWWARRR